ncbi:sensor histidine kinase [Treponema sp. HNW]|uniref:cache domain-containing sensor histidine kinase n=1 Tax=Treponema sp. HNW TaxID=3116654 RepID=UPI003D111550
MNRLSAEQGRGKAATDGSVSERGGSEQGAGLRLAKSKSPLPDLQNTYTHLKQRFSSGIFKKLILINICIGSIPVFLLTFFILIHSYRSTNTEIQRAYEQVLEHLTENTNTRFANYYDMIEHLCANVTIHAAMTDKSEKSGPWINGAIISREVNKYIRLNKNLGLDKCMVYSEVPGCPVYHQNATTREYAMYEYWYDVYKNTQQDYFFYTKPDTGEVIMSLIKPVIATDFSNPYYGKRLGFIKLDIDLQDFFNSFLPIEPDTAHTVFILSEENRILYKKRSTLYEIDETDLLQKIRNGVSIYRLPKSGRLLFLVQKRTACNGIKAVICFKNNTVREKLVSILKATVLMGFTSVILIFFFAYHLSGKIAVRVNTLIAKMKQVEHGDLEIQNTHKKNEDEIGIIEKQFDKMVVRLSRAIEQNYITELENKEASLRLLQFQINPHFLYNTLESVSAIAMQKKAYVICEITEKLSALFRYAVSKQPGESVGFAEELRHIENYIYIQSIRFPSAFSIRYSVPQELRNCLMPCFILQPPVENSFNHGLKECKSGGLIEISARAEQSVLYIEIKDNGRGIETGRLKQIKAHLHDDGRCGKIKSYEHSIGLKNVHSRIQTAYGKAYGADIESIQGKGTRVILKLPLLYPETKEKADNKQNGKNDVQYTHRR